jgi:hypothetical protein
MRLKIMLAATAIAALTAGGAYAQGAMSNQSTAAPPPASDASTTAPSASEAGMPAAAATSGALMSSPTPVDQAYTLKAGDPNVISNGPVPDTPANRKLYGQPMSNAGRHTAPAGN